MLEEKATMSRTAFDLWFSDLHLVSISDDKVILATPQDLKRKFIADRYMDFVRECVWDALDYKPKVEIICDGIKEFSEAVNPNTKEKLSKGRFGQDSDLKNETEEEVKSSGLNPEFTFENFVVGSSNQLAHACSVAVSNSPGGDLGYNPLFIYGPSGLGKTHLMYAIANAVHDRDPEKAIICVNSEEFLNELIDCVSRKNMKRFRDKYIKADMLLVLQDMRMKMVHIMR